MQETTARVQFDKKYLIALVLPLVIEQVLAVTVGMADMIMVSGAGIPQYPVYPLSIRSAIC